MKRSAPSPRGRLLTGHLHRIRHDVLGLLEESTRDHGDIVRFKVGPLVFHLLNHPDHVSHVMIRNRRNYDKASRSSENIGLICGESLLTSNGPAWQLSRRTIQPMFHRSAVAGFVSSISDCTRDMLDGWREKEETDVASEMMKLTFRVVGQCLFGADLGREAETVEGAMHRMMLHTYHRWRSLLPPPASWPTPANLRFRRSLAEVDNIISRLIAAQRAHPPETPNLLSMLLHGEDTETGAALSDQAVRNEAITFLLAGHETTANGLAWTLFLLCRHPEWITRIREEFQAVCGDRTPTMEDLPKLTDTLHVFEESIRLYPPIWAMERRAIADDEIGGFHIPRNSGVIVSPYLLHRHPDFWEEPAAFRPERFTKRDHGSYYPFGAGPRFCIGSEFALAEARVILPMILREFDLEEVPGQTIEAEPSITLRIKDGFRVRLRPRCI
jgi:cytochrome P450